MAAISQKSMDVLGGCFCGRVSAFLFLICIYNETGERTINSGFVRVESRNGQCRLSIHMSGIYHSEAKKYQIYMLIRVSGDYIGIAIGDLLVQKQTGDMELTMDSDHLMGTTYDLDRVAGMVLLGEDGSVYGTDGMMNRWKQRNLSIESRFQRF